MPLFDLADQEEPGRSGRVVELEIVRELAIPLLGLLLDEDGEIEGKLTTLAVKQMLEGKVTYYDAKERREQERGPGGARALQEPPFAAPSSARASSAACA